MADWPECVLWEDAEVLKISRSKVYRWLAWRLPRAVAMWCAIRVSSDLTEELARLELSQLKWPQEWLALPDYNTRDIVLSDGRTVRAETYSAIHEWDHSPSIKEYQKAISASHQDVVTELTYWHIIAWRVRPQWILSTRKNVTSLAADATGNIWSLQVRTRYYPDPDSRLAKLS